MQNNKINEMKELKASINEIGWGFVYMLLALSMLFGITVLEIREVGDKVSQCVQQETAR